MEKKESGMSKLSSVEFDLKTESLKRGIRKENKPRNNEIENGIAILCGCSCIEKRSHIQIRYRFYKINA
jgi:hypothetical protein